MGGGRNGYADGIFLGNGGAGKAYCCGSDAGRHGCFDDSHSGAPFMFVIVLGLFSLAVLRAAKG